MSLTTAKSIVSGAIFGAALTAAGVYSPSVIIGQLHLENFRMLKTFLTANASSVLAILAAQTLNLSTCKPRTPSSLSLFNTYDGNILGGLLLGAGMALTGACPGTVLPQLATQIPSALPVLTGCLLGGILFSKLKPLFPPPPLPHPAFTQPALHQRLNLSRTISILTYETLLLSLIATATSLSPEKSTTLVSPLTGGLLVGASQAASLLLTASTLGVSTAYEQFGDLFWWIGRSIFESHNNNDKKIKIKNKNIPNIPNIKGMAFALGTFLGSILLTRLINLPTSSAGVDLEISNPRALVGGVLLVLGARVAGGCTSGHGISGMAQLSSSSFVTVGCMFGGGVLVGRFV